MKEMFFVMRVFCADWTKSITERRSCFFEISHTDVGYINGMAEEWRKKSDRFFVYITSEEVG